MCLSTCSEAGWADVSLERVVAPVLVRFYFTKWVTSDVYKISIFIFGFWS